MQRRWLGLSSSLPGAPVCGAAWWSRRWAPSRGFPSSETTGSAKRGPPGRGGAPAGGLSRGAAVELRRAPGEPCAGLCGPGGASSGLRREAPVAHAGCATGLVKVFTVFWGRVQPFYA